MVTNPAAGMEERATAVARPTIRVGEVAPPVADAASRGEELAPVLAELAARREEPASGRADSAAHEQELAGVGEEPGNHGEGLVGAGADRAAPMEELARAVEEPTTLAGEASSTFSGETWAAPRSTGIRPRWIGSVPQRNGANRGFRWHQGRIGPSSRGSVCRPGV